MLARLITQGADALPALHLPELPRAGDTLTGPDGAVWRVKRVNWPMTAEGRCEAAELHLARVSVDL